MRYFLLVSVMTLTLWSVTQQAVAQKPENKADSNSTTQQQTPAVQVTVNNEATANERRSEQNKSQDATRPFLTAGEIVSAGLTFTYALISLFILLAIRSQSESMQEANRISRENLVAVQRAFVFVRSFEVVRVFDDATAKLTGYHIMPMWENSGTTPTKNVRDHVSYWLDSQTLPNDFDFPDRGDMDKGRFVLGPKHTIGGGRPIFLTLAQMKDIQAGKLHFYIWGWARYHDVFSGTEEHITEFCREIVGVRGNPEDVSSNLVFQIRVYRTHNTAT